MRVLFVSSVRSLLREFVSYLHVLQFCSRVLLILNLRLDWLIGTLPSFVADGLLAQDLCQVGSLA